ncbi:MAG: type II toxin-antitoxin system PemK/MazF family toxin [Faecalibacterium sp.]
MDIHRGEVFYADLSPVVGSEQGGIRPVLIVQNEIGNRHSPTVIAAAITSKLDKSKLPTHIGIRAESTGLAKDSIVLLEQIRTIDKQRLRERAGQITPEDQQRVDEALDVSLGLHSF